MEEPRVSEWVKLKAEDGHELSGYLARPEGEAIGSLVMVQEIFGVNQHIRSVADSYAKDGFLVLAPALFDRTENGVELSYEGEDMQKAVALMQKLDPKTALLDVAAAYHHLESEGKGVGVIGYCYGGFMAWLSATRGEDLKMQPDCCVGYYAGGIGKVAKEEPSCPVMLHFGADDSHIGKDQVDAVREAHAEHKDEVQIFVYEGAGHGFACNARSSYNAEAAKLARERSLEFLKSNIA
jgi:carboxymethylenebutenolidase